MKYVVTGGTGFLGRHLVSRLEAAGHAVAVPRSASTDLLQLGHVLDFLAHERPDRVIHSAAYYGGLGINVVEPATIYFRNITMGANLFEAARQVDSIRKVVVVGTACSYPGKLENLMREEDFWAGPVHGSVENYGLTKKIMSVQGRAYKTQYGLESVHLVLTNLYGQWDSYNPHRSHVVAALVRKFVEAKRANASEVRLWGTGTPVREFLYVEDCADAIIEAGETYADLQHPLNIGTGIGTSIKELAETIRDLTQFAGELVWETDKPDGQAMKILDPTRARAALTWRPTHSLRDGLAKTIAWYDAHKAEADARW
jgi:nucleoside-diphosphate-sugar epimerase